MLALFLVLGHGAEPYLMIAKSVTGPGACSSPTEQGEEEEVKEKVVKEEEVEP